jgi:hypothetical protein
MAVLEKVSKRVKTNSLFKMGLNLSCLDISMARSRNPARTLAWGKMEEGLIREPIFPRWGVVELKKRSPRR